MFKDIPVMILAGGLGTRLREETEFRPKPMVPIGGKPILWHIMKIYSHFGFSRFIICLGYKGEMIKKYFLDYQFNEADFTVNTQTGSIVTHKSHNEEWEITLVDTGSETLTGGRVARALSYVDTDTFFLTYGDAVADVNIQASLDFHLQHKKIATMTTVPLPSRFGNVQYDDQSLVTSFLEKNQINDQLINGGFFVLDKKIQTYLPFNDELILEQGPLQSLAEERELMMYRHTGFWQCMDTLREKQKLEALWQTTPPWKLWEDQKKYSPASSVQSF